MPRWCRGRDDRGLFHARPGTVTGKNRFALPPLVRGLVVTMIAPTLGLGLQPAPGAVQHLRSPVRVLATSGILPATLIASVLNLILPGGGADKSTGEMTERFAGDSNSA